VSLVLRKIRKSKWYKNEGVPWLAEGELQADALSDLATKDNELSVWRIEGNRSNLERVVVALAAGCDYISNFDYALFDQETLSEINIRIKNTEGDSPDEDANSWHVDLAELSATKLMELATAIMRKAEIKRIPEKSILRLVARAVASGQIDRTKLRLKSPDDMTKLGRLVTAEGSGL